MTIQRILKFSNGLALCGLAAACSGGDRPRDVSPSIPTDWRRVITDADRGRLRNWRAAWMAALGQVRQVGESPELGPHGALFEPDRALANPLPPPGDYRCRVFKLGTKGATGLAYTAYPFFDCRIDDEGEVLSFYKRSGSQRPVGLVFKDGDARGVFLGTLMLGDETAALEYGQDSSRDMAGVIERVADRRWRLTLPYPAFESTLDVIELVPAE